MQDDMSYLPKYSSNLSLQPPNKTPKYYIVDANPIKN